VQGLGVRRRRRLKAGVSMKTREILSVAILAIALTEGAARGDSVYRDREDAPVGARYVPSTADWKDGFLIGETAAADEGHFAAPLDAAPLAGAEPPHILKTPPTVPSSQVHALPLPSTVWSGGVLLAVTAGALWARKRRRAGEIAMT